MTKRRGHNEGSYYRTADGRLRASVTVRGLDGTVSRKYFDGRTRKELQARVAAFRELHRAGLPTTDATQTLASFLERWRADTAPAVKPLTVSSREVACRRFGAIIGGVRLCDLAPAHIQAAVKALSETLAPITVRGYLAILKTALGDAVDWKILRENPATSVHPPRVETQERPTLTIDQTAHLLIGVATDPWCALWTLFATTAVRRGEALGLRWQDVDLDRGEIAIRQQLQNQPGRGLAFSTPKSHAGVRRLPLVDAAIAALRAHHEASGAPAPDALVFLGPKGLPFGPALMNYYFHKMLRRHGLPAMRPHDLRHSVATEMIRAGVHLQIVADYLGHESTRTTERVYAHVTPGMRRDAVEQLDQRLRRAIAAAFAATGDLPRADTAD